MEVAEFGQFPLLEEEEKHSERQVGQREQSILALLKVKGRMGSRVHLFSRRIEEGLKLNE